MSVVVYVKAGDPYSFRLLEFLKRKHVTFTSKYITDDDPEVFEEMTSVTGEMETPQVVINGKHIGDYERVTSLDLQGKFDSIVMGSDERTKS